MDDILLSYIIPVYNASQYLECCVNSIINQESKQLEVILVNDGSTDDSLTICTQLGMRDTRIIIINQENGGPAKARNSGLKVAKGKYIAFVDSDDWIGKEHFNKLCNLFCEDYDFICFTYQEEYSQKHKKKVSGSKIIKISDCQIKQLERDSIDTGLKFCEKRIKPFRAQLWTKVYNRDFLISNRIWFNENLKRYQDVFFNLEVYHHAQKGLLLPDILYHYRMLENSISHDYNSNQKNYVLSFVDELEQYLCKERMMDEYRIAYAARLVMTVGILCQIDFCHPNNPEEYKKRKKKFMELRNDPRYVSALKITNLSNFTLAKMLIYLFINFKFFRGLDIIFRYARH